jgi:hypothetical protein
MQDDERTRNGVCRRCGSSEASAAADARAIGLLDEFLAGEYACCQVVQWADEQWLAWHEAGSADGKVLADVTAPLEMNQAEPVFVPVRVRKPNDPKS